MLLYLGGVLGSWLRPKKSLEGKSITELLPLVQYLDVLQDLAAVSTDFFSITAPLPLPVHILVTCAGRDLHSPPSLGMALTVAPSIKSCDADYPRC